MNVQEITMRNASGVYSRKVWLLEAPQGKPAKLGIFLDGEYYVNHMDAPAMIAEMQKNVLIPYMTCLFVSHVNGEARHQDLTCNREYSDFIAGDLFGWIRERNGEISAGGHLIAGTSLGGLASAYLSLSYPQIFPCCLSHSGSFWYKNEWLTKNMERMPVSQNKFWLSVGNQEIACNISHPPTGLRQETTQIDACERFKEALITRDHSVYYNQYEGGHEIKPWKSELPSALQWLLN